MALSNGSLRADDQIIWTSRPGQESVKVKLSIVPQTLPMLVPKL